MIKQLALMTSFALSTQAQLPQIAYLDQATVDDAGWKIVVVNTAHVRYVLGCDVNQKTCITPEAGKGYYVIDRNTKTTLPGASEPITLKFLEDYSIS